MIQWGWDFYPASICSENINKNLDQNLLWYNFSFDQIIFELDFFEPNFFEGQHSLQQIDFGLIC